MDGLLEENLRQFFKAKQSNEIYCITWNSGYHEEEVRSAIRNLNSNGFSLKAFYEGLGRWKIKNNQGEMNRQTSYSAIHFATNIVEMYKENTFKQELSNQRLQRLIFLFYLHYLKEFDKHFFQESFFAFKLGGVIKEVYSKYKLFMYYINQPAKYFVTNSVGITYEDYPKMPLTTEQTDFLFKILQMYDHLDEWELAYKCINLMKSESIVLQTTITKKQLVNMSSYLQNETN